MFTSRLVISICLALISAYWAHAQTIQSAQLSRSLAVVRSQYELSHDDFGNPAIKLTIWVEHQGLAGQPITSRTGLRLPDGRPIQATASAMAGSVKPDGTLEWVTHGALDGAVNPTGFWTLIPFHVMQLPQQTPFIIVRSDLESQGIRTYYDAALSFSPSGVTFQKGVLISSLRHESRVEVSQQPNPAGMAVQNPNIYQTNVVQSFTSKNNVAGLGGQSLYFGLCFKDANGRFVGPSSSCPQGHVGSQGQVQVQQSESIMSQQVEWVGQPISMPMDWTRLDLSRDQRVIAVYYISAAGLWNVMELELLLPGTSDTLDSLVFLDEGSNQGSSTDADNIWANPPLDRAFQDPKPGSGHVSTPFPLSTPAPLANFSMIPGVRHDLDLPGTLAQATITPQTGGVVTASSASMTVPPGAVPQNTTLFIKQYRGKPSGVPIPRAQAVGIGPVVDFGPEGVQFNRPVTLTLSYDPAALPGHLDPQNICALYYNGGQWIPVPSLVDTVNHTVSIQAESLPGITATAAYLLVALGTVTAIGWATGELQEAYDSWEGDPSTQGIAWQYVTPEDPVVKHHATILVAPNSQQRGLYEVVQSPTQLQNLFNQFNTDGNLTVAFQSGRGIKRPVYQIVDNWGHDWIKPAEYFSNGMKGDCKNMANAYCSVFRALGFQAKCVDGEGQTERHVWCEIALNGVPYYVDLGEMTPLEEARKEGLITRFDRMWDEEKQEPYRDNWWLRRGEPIVYTFSGSFGPKGMNALGKPKKPGCYHKFTPPQITFTVSPDGKSARFETFSYSVESCVMVNDQPSDFNQRGVIEAFTVQCLTGVPQAKPGSFHGRCKVWRKYHDWDKITINSAPERKYTRDYDEPWYASKETDANGRPYLILQIGHPVNRTGHGGTIKYDFVLR